MRKIEFSSHPAHLPNDLNCRYVLSFKESNLQVSVQFAVMQSVSLRLSKLFQN